MVACNICMNSSRPAHFASTERQTHTGTRARAKQFRHSQFKKIYTQTSCFSVGVVLRHDSFDFYLSWPPYSMREAFHHCESTQGANFCNKQHGRPLAYQPAARECARSDQPLCFFCCFSRISLFAEPSASAAIPSQSLGTQYETIAAPVKYSQTYAYFYLFVLQTYNNDAQIGDSSACATALLCGVKANTETLGLDAGARFEDCRGSHMHRVTSIFDWAQKEGKSHQNMINACQILEETGLT